MMGKLQREITARLARIGRQAGEAVAESKNKNKDVEQTLTNHENRLRALEQAAGRANKEGGTS